VSTILIVGGSGAYFDVCDAVVMMREYAPSDVTEKALKIVREMSAKSGTAATLLPFNALTHRSPLKVSVNPVGSMGGGGGLCVCV